MTFERCHACWHLRSVCLCSPVPLIRLAGSEPLTTEPFTAETFEAAARAVGDLIRRPLPEPLHPMLWNVWLAREHAEGRHLDIDPVAVYRHAYDSAATHLAREVTR